MDQSNSQRVKELSSLPIEKIIEKYIELERLLDEAVKRGDHYEELFRLSQIRTFAPRSEKGFPGQMSLEGLGIFNEAEQHIEDAGSADDAVEDRIGDGSVESLKISNRIKRKKSVKNLPVVTSTYELSEDEQVCSCCGGRLHKIKDEVYEEIETIPALVQLHRHISTKYGCRQCQKKGLSGIVVAPGAPRRVIAKCIASSSTIADCITKKYVDATPFDRQEKNNERAGIPISKDNMVRWSMGVATSYFSHIVNRMKRSVFAETAIHCDETEVQVLHEEGKTPQSKSRIWVMTTPESQKNYKIALYAYRPGRSDEDAREVLKGYEGYIMCDGCPTYDAITHKSKKGDPPMRVRPVACMVHVRRKFADALKLLKPAERKGTGPQTAINKIARIFHIDNAFNDLSVDDRKERRIKELKPELEAFFKWVEEERKEAVPKMRYGEALTYAHNQKEKVMRVLEDGHLELDNNMAERAVKPFVIGRKNWLFSNTVNGAETSCIIYSLIETAKLNNLIPYKYIKYLLDVMPGKAMTDEFIDSLLPWSESIPQEIRKPAQD